MLAARADIPPHPPPGKESKHTRTHQAHLSSPVFRRPPEAVIILQPFFILSRVAKKNAFLLSSSSPPAFLIVLPSTATSESCQKPRERNMKKIILAATWRFASRET